MIIIIIIDYININNNVTSPFHLSKYVPYILHLRKRNLLAALSCLYVRKHSYTYKHLVIITLSLLPQSHTPSLSQLITYSYTLSHSYSHSLTRVKNTLQPHCHSMKKCALTLHYNTHVLYNNLSKLLSNSFLLLEVSKRFLTITRCSISKRMHRFRFIV